jgi:hypothetical protein
MCGAKTAKTISLLIIHLVATYVSPGNILPSHRIHKAADTGLLEILNPGGLATYDAGLGLTPRQEGDGGSCDRRAKFKKKIRDPNNDPSASGVHRS